MIAFVVLLLFCPLLLAIALATRLESGESALVSQQRTGFRGRIPLLAVVPPGASTSEALAVRAADRVEGWQATSIAYAVQEMAELAAAERRELLRKLAAETEASIPAALSPRELVMGVRRRELPTAEIAEAFANFQSARDRSPRA